MQQIITPAKLALLLQSKNNAAFSILYNNYSAVLYRLIKGIVKNKNAADDLLQDVFMKIWRSIDLYNAEKGTIYTWMVFITTRTCIDYMRSKHCCLEARTIENGLDADEVAELGIEPIYNITDLYTNTLKLGSKYREIIELIFFRGHTQDEVAVLLKLPVGTVKTRSRTGIKALRDMYQWQGAVA